MAGSGSPATVQEWLQSLHLEQFVNDFLFFGYTDLSKCFHITEADLVKLGITQVGYQKRILSRLPSEADAFVREFSAPNPAWVGTDMDPPVPSPRTKNLVGGKKPSIDKEDYMEVGPKTNNVHHGAPDVFGRGDMGDSAPRSQKPIIKPRNARGATVKRDPPPPLPVRGRPVPQPRNPPPVPPTISTPAPPLAPLPESLPTQPPASLPPRLPVPLPPSLPTRPTIPETLPQFVPPLLPEFVADSLPPFLPAPLQATPVTTHVPLTTPSVSSLPHTSDPLPDQFGPVDLLITNGTEDAVHKTGNPFMNTDEEETEFSFNPVIQNPNNPFTQSPTGSLFNRPVPQPPSSPGENLTSSDAVMSNPEKLSKPGIDLSSRPLPPPPPIAPSSSGVDSLFSRPVPKPPEMTSFKGTDDAPMRSVPKPPEIISLRGSDDLKTPETITLCTDADDGSTDSNSPPPPPLPGKKKRSRSEPANLNEFLKMRQPPPQPPSSIAEEGQPKLPALPPRPPPVNDIASLEPELPSPDVLMSQISNAKLIDDLMKEPPPEVNANIEKKELNDSLMLNDNFMQPSLNMDRKSPSVDSSRKSTHSSRSSQDDTHMNWPDSDHSDVPFSGLPKNPSSTLSSVGSTESDKILKVLDSYNHSDMQTSSQGSFPSADTSLTQEESYDEPSITNCQFPEEEENIYGALWSHESRPVSGVSESLTNIFKNPPPLSDPSDEVCYLPLSRCSTGHARPPSTVDGDMPSDMPADPPPPIPTPRIPTPPIPTPPIPTTHSKSTPLELPADINTLAMPESSPPPIPVRPAPPPPPNRIHSIQGDSSKSSLMTSTEDVLIQLKETDDDYDLVGPSSSTLSSLSSSDHLYSSLTGTPDDGLPSQIDFTEADNSDTDDEDFPITIPDGRSDSGISSTGVLDDPFGRNSDFYASIRQSTRPHQRKVNEEARRRLSLRLSTSQSNIPIPVKLEKSGYLWKCGAGRQGKGGFRKRWFVFNGKELRYYENERTMTTCKGIIPVGAMLDVKHLHKTAIGDKKSRIELITNARTYYFATDNCDDGTIWANMLMQAIIAFQPPPGGFPLGGDMSCPDKEGYLKMEGCNQKRYFAVKGEMLCYYTSENDFNAAVPISDIQMKLANARVNTPKPERLILTTPSTTYQLTAESSDEAKEWVDAMMEAVSEGLSDKLYLHQVWENKANRLCADCNMPDPDWCSLNFGIVICKKCSGIHRQLGVHISKVRSLKMDVRAFTESALEVFSAVGNKLSNNFWEKMLEPTDRFKPMPDDSIEQRKMFIVKKYVDRQYCDHILWEKEHLDRELLKAVQEGRLQDCLKLIYSGANVEAVNGDGKTARELSYGHNLSPVIKELLEQNKDYSNHQQDILNQMSHPSPQPPGLPTGGQVDDPHGFPVPLPRRKPSPMPQHSGRSSPTTSQGSPSLPARTAPLPPVPSPKQEQFASSVESIQEQIRKAGFLYKTGSNRRDFLRRYCVLEHGTFCYYQDDKANQAAKNLIEGTDMVYVAVGAPKQGHEFCFEIGTTLGRLYLFAAEDAADRRNWMSTLVKFHTPECMWKDCEDYEYAGFLRKKVGRASTQWQRLWFLLKGKLLSFYSAEKDGMEIIDLRKVIEISQEFEEGSKEQVKDVAIIVKGRAIYLRADTQQISDAWMAALQKNASQIGPELEDQLLTEGHIPHIVKECIEFVYIHQGLEQEGIYRLSGTATKIQKVREMFRANPRSVHIDRDEFQVNDVSGALKKYFRELPDPVLTKKWYEKWTEVSDYTDHNVKLQWYKYVLEQLPRVHYHTLKTIIAHLNRVKEKERINKMTAKNLASVFGPTLMALPDSTFGNAEKEIAVIGDLMMYYLWLFDVDEKEWEEEEKKVKKLTEIQALISAKPKPSNGIVMTFYIRNKNEGNSISLPLQETMTAKEVVESVVKKHNLPTLDGKPWGLFEVVENGELERMLFDYEVVLSEVGAWDPATRANNYLCIKQNSLLHGMEVFLKNMSSSASIKYAENSRKFKDFYFEISGNIMRFCKQGNKSGGGGPISYWDIVPLKIYLGIGPKFRKNAPTRWGITFLASGERDYKCLCFDSESVMTMWLAGLFRCKLQEPKRSALSNFEAGDIRQRTSSLKLKVPWKRHHSITD